MEEHVLINIVLVIVLGVGAQWLAWRVKIPSILLLLLLGFVAGPITGIIAPSSLHGDWLFAFVSLAIGIILFEGGLSLQISELAEVGRTVRNLITTGVLVTGVLAALFAWGVIGMTPEVAILTGGILTVTGPTVVIPLLRHVRPRGRVSTIAKWEGITIDPVGAILAILLLEVVLTISAAGSGTGGDAALGLSIVEAGQSLLRMVILSVGVSILGAALQVIILRKHLVSDYLQDPAALTIVLGAFAVADVLGGEGAALLTTTLMGAILANQPWVSVRRIVKFKEDLQVLLLAGLFILLSARLDISVLEYINARAFIFLAILIFVVRPLAVWLCSLRTGLNWKEKVFISWLAPRGIVAAAVAALFAERLIAEGFPAADGDMLIATVYLVVVGTVAVYGLTLSPIALRLGLADRNPQGVMFMGAYGWVQDAAMAIQDLGMRVLLIDANARNILEARDKDLPAVVADALSETATDELDLGGLRRFLAVTGNDEVNSLAALHFTEIFENKEVYQIGVQEDSRDSGARRAGHLRGRTLFGDSVTYSMLAQWHREGGQVEVFGLSEPRSYEAVKERFGYDTVLLFVVRGNNLLVNAASSQLTPASQDVVVVMLPPQAAGKDRQAVDQITQVLETPVLLEPPPSDTIDEVIKNAAQELAPVIGMPTEAVATAITESVVTSRVHSENGTMVVKLESASAQRAALMMIRSEAGIMVDGAGAREGTLVHRMIILAIPQGEGSTSGLALLAQIMGAVRRRSFKERWREANDAQELCRVLGLHHPPKY